MSNSNSKRVLVTAALPYSNNRPHVGHLAGCYLPADTYVRYLRLCGRDVRFICGSDDHGVAIKISAAKEGRSPAELAAYYNEIQKNNFAASDIHFDIYSSTSRCPQHYELSQRFFLSMFDKGYLQEEISKQFYDNEKDMFLPDRYVRGTCGYCGAHDQNSDQCEECGKVLDVDHLSDAYSTVSGKPASVRETKHWFLDLSRFEEPVKKWLKTAQTREQTKAFVSGLLGTGLVRRSMTRDLDWGIPVPLATPDAKDKVLYVWFDAPIGYISFTEEYCQKRNDSAANWWQSDDCEIYHFIGEDNTIFHCVIWIAMLSAEASYKLPKAVIVNQYLNIQFPGKEAEKISKSKGNAVWLQDYFDNGGESDSLRYYLTVNAPERARTAYNPIDLIQRHNSDLANTLGNFVNRIISFSIKHYGPIVPELAVEQLDSVDTAFQAALVKLVEEVTVQMDACNFRSALELIMQFARECNRYVDSKAPWVAIKSDKDKTQSTLAIAINAIYALGVLLNPFIPKASQRILNAFDKQYGQPKWQQALTFPSAGSGLKKPEILFAKLELPESKDIVT